MSARMLQSRTSVPNAKCALGRWVHMCTAPCVFVPVGTSLRGAGDVVAGGGGRGGHWGQVPVGVPSSRLTRPHQCMRLVPCASPWLPWVPRGLHHVGPAQDHRQAARHEGVRVRGPSPPAAWAVHPCVPRYQPTPPARVHTCKPARVVRVAQGSIGELRAPSLRDVCVCVCVCAASTPALGTWLLMPA